MGKLFKSFGQLSFQSDLGDGANRILIPPKQFSDKKQKNQMVRNSLLMNILEMAHDDFQADLTSLPELSLLQNLTTPSH